MREDQIISVLFSVVAVVVVFSARTCFGGNLVGFDFSWLGIKWSWSPFFGWERTEVEKK